MAEMTIERKVNIYAAGLCYASVCAPPDMAREEVERQTNLSHPTGLAHGWTVADEPFGTGEANPHMADNCGQHWLLSC